MPLHVDEGRLELLHVHRARELEVELIEGEQVGEGHRVADDHHVPAVRADDGAAAHVVGGVGDDRQREGGGRRRIDVLADLANTPLDLTLDLSIQLRATLGVEPPAITLSSRFRLDRASSSIDWRATRAEPSLSTTDCVCASRSRISADWDSWVSPPVSMRWRSSATAAAWPSARRVRLHASSATAATPINTHTRSSANNSSNSDMWGIVVREVGIDKGVNLSKLATPDPAAQPERVPDRIPLEEVYMRMAEELAKRSTCAR